MNFKIITLSVFVVLALTFTVIAKKIFGVASVSEQNKTQIVNAVTIIAHHDGGEVWCKKFTATKRQITEYLKVKQPAKSRQYTKDLYSVCRIEGYYISENKDKIDFFLQSSGMSMMKMPNGEEAFFFAEPQWADPSAGSYGNPD